MPNERVDAAQKAKQINSDARRYGTFAEIGAGQEVARWFFRVGGAAKTVAKTISAYDMAVSDAIYGPTERYVSRRRLKAIDAALVALGVVWLVAGVAALRRGPPAPITAKSSWFEKILNGARVASTIWFAFRPRGEKEGHQWPRSPPRSPARNAQ